VVKDIFVGFGGLPFDLHEVQRELSGCQNQDDTKSSFKLLLLLGVGIHAEFSLHQHQTS
jgi:hypothetical protein